MRSLEIFINRLNKVGVVVELSINYPWVYLEKANGRSLTEKSISRHGFNIAYLPMKIGSKTKFINISKTFNIIRSYEQASQETRIEKEN